MLTLALSLFLAAGPPAPSVIKTRSIPTQAAGPSNKELPAEWVAAAAVGAAVCLLVAGATVLGVYYVAAGQYGENK